MTFQERLQSLIQRIEGRMPSDDLKIMHGATKALAESGIQDGVLKVGQQAPAFTLQDESGHSFSSAEYLQKGPLVLTFYRGFWCPYCNADLANLKKYAAEIREAGAELVALSPELPEYSKKIIATQRLNYSILHDPSNEIAGQFGLKWFMQAPLKALYLNKFNIDLAQYHGDQEWSLPMPARVLVDTSGAIRYIEFEPDYRNRPDPDELIATLQQLPA